MELRDRDGELIDIGDVVTAPIPFAGEGEAEIIRVLRKGRVRLSSLQRSVYTKRGDARPVIFTADAMDVALVRRSG